MGTYRAGAGTPSRYDSSLPSMFLVVESRPSAAAQAPPARGGCRGGAEERHRDLPRWLIIVVGEHEGDGAREETDDRRDQEYRTRAPAQVPGRERRQDEAPERVGEPRCPEAEAHGQGHGARDAGGPGPDMQPRRRGHLLVEDREDERSPEQADGD